MFSSLARQQWVRSSLPVLVAAVVIMTAPSLVTGSFWQRVIILALFNVVLAMSLNLVIGYTGLLALGHGAFLGIGAYTSAVLTTTYEWAFWAAFFVAGITAAACGLLLAVITLRLRGHYLAIATLGFAVIVYQVLMNWIDVTRGPLGIPGIPTPPNIPLGNGTELDFGLPAAHIYLAGAFAIVCYVLIRRIVNSPMGDALRAVREDEISAKSLGIRTFAWKCFAFTVAAFAAGLTGSLYAGYMGILEPSAFVLTVSFTLLAMVIVGGAGTLVGPVIGALVLTIVPEALREVGPEYRMILYGLALTLVVLFFPQGLVGIGAALRSRFRSSSRSKPDEPPSDSTGTGFAKEVPVDAS
ncbi:MAG: branched-chain amino acid ABC transporter permease [Propionibacteriales bacterium]|nr:branched-chain amino acid ABC transporter permease [Propionibacteriales bacterium]